MDERVLDAMRPYFFARYAVATSEFGHSPGIEARESLEAARESLAAVLGALPEEIVFTSGSTESSNLALQGVAGALGERRGRHMVVSTIEDFPVLHTARALEKRGFRVTYIPVDRDGLVDEGELSRSIASDTILVSIQHANQEIGTVQKIEELARVAKRRGALFHTDATHSFTRIPLDLGRVPADLVTIAAHTIHGPRGIGALFVRKGTPLAPLLHGGFQEQALRPGLENIPGVVGFARAAMLVTEEETRRIRALRDRLITRLLSEIPDVTLNGHRSRRLPQNANVTFHFVEGESIALHLDMRGFAVSTGSACFSRSLEASHVIMAIGGDHERAHGSVRFTFGRFNKPTDADRAVEVVSDVVEKLRAMSPLGPARKRGTAQHERAL